MKCVDCGANLPFDSYGNVMCQFCNAHNYIPIPEGKKESMIQKVITISGEGSCPKCEFPSNKINKRINIVINTKKWQTDPELTVTGYLCPKCGYKYVLFYSDIKMRRRGVCPTCYGAFKKHTALLSRTLYLKCDDCGAELRGSKDMNYTQLRDRAQEILEDRLNKNPNMVKSALMKQGYDISYL